MLTAEVKPGKKWEKEGKRGGKLKFRENIVEYRDQKGELVITARGVGVQPEKVVEQVRSRSMDMALKASKLKVGDEHSEQVCDNLSRTQIVMYAGASGDYNPLHCDEVFTTRSRVTRPCSRTAC